MKDENKKEVKKVVKKSTPKKSVKKEAIKESKVKDAKPTTSKKEPAKKTSVKKEVVKDSKSKVSTSKQSPTNKRRDERTVKKNTVTEAKKEEKVVETEIPKVEVKLKVEEKKVEEPKSKWDKLVFFLCILMICIFIILLPNFNSMVRNRKKADEHIEEEKIPVSYFCKMNRESETDGYTMQQEATYVISDKKVIKTSIVRVYSFENIDYYKSWKEENGKSLNLNGQKDTFGFDESNLKITKKIEQNISVMNASDLDPNFPKTYANLLIYTKDQDCKAKY